MVDKELQSLLRTGIQAARAGDKQKARRIFERVLEADDSSELAWMWMASVVSTAEERRVCLENVLDINPNNARAIKALARMKARPVRHAKPPAASKPAAPKAPARKPDLPQEDVPVWESSEWESRLDAVLPPAPAAEPVSKASSPPRAKPAPVARSTRRRRNPRLVLGVGAVSILLVIVVAGILIVQTNNKTQDARDADGVVSTGPTALPPEPTKFEIVDPATLKNTLVPTWTPEPSPTSVIATPSPVPLQLDSYMLIYASRISGQSSEDIYAIRADGSEEEIRLTNDPARDIEPAVSPDGQQFVFVSDRNGGFDLYINSVDGQQGARRITELSAESLESPTWSPDGQQIAFSAKLEGGDSEIYIITLDAPQDPFQVTDNTEVDQEPAWSPDGQVIAFASDRTSRGFLQIFSVPADCATEFGRCDEMVTQLTHSQNSSKSPAWSPTGEYIAFVSNRVWSDDEDIYIMRDDGTDARLLTLDEYGDNGGSDLQPAWSRDGLWLAFASNRDGDWLQVYVMMRDGSGVTRVTSFVGNATHPVWLSQDY